MEPGSSPSYQRAPEASRLGASDELVLTLLQTVHNSTLWDKNTQT